MRPNGFPPLSPGEAAFLLGEVEAFEPDWLLVLPYVGTQARAAWLSVLAFAAEVIGAPARVSQPMLGQVRLQWWREALDEVFGPGAARRHPVVTALEATLAERHEVQEPLSRLIDGVEAFLWPGEDDDLDAAIAIRRPVHGALAEALARIAGSPDGGDGLVLHALSRSAPDGSLEPGEGGHEPPARRFSRALGRRPGIETELAARINAYRQAADGTLALPALPLRLVRARGRVVRRIANPFAQRAAILAGVLRGRV